NGNFLREYIVVDTCSDLRGSVRANPSTGAGCLANLSLSGPGAARTTGPAQPAAPAASGTTAGAARPTPKPSPCPSLPVSALPALLFHPPALPWSRTLHVSLEAASFGQLNSAASVELAGTRIGTVEGLDLRDARPLVRLSIDQAYAGLLHADASAAIRPHGLL